MKPPQIILTDAAEQCQPIVCNITQDFYDTFFKESMEQETCLVLDTENAKKYFKQ
jgi:CDP-glycerol glycerophosphotransferase (TagB/SpsB family)